MHGCKAWPTLALEQCVDFCSKPQELFLKQNQEGSCSLLENTPFSFCLLLLLLLLKISPGYHRIIRMRAYSELHFIFRKL